MSVQTKTFGSRAVTPVARRLRVGRASARPSHLWLIGLLRRWRKRMKARRQLSELCRLDDHILRDIGLTRSGLRWEANRLSER
jgi:uncharacterized protein YjiS (DUF1127 family)